VPKPRYRLTRLAGADFAEILRFTRRRWGQQQLAIYHRLLDDGVTAVAQEPERLNSHGRDDLRSGLRSFHIGLLATRPSLGHHVIYYRIAGDDVVEILRILHERMEISSRLP
jgi:toxin ParE1/3/4